MIDLYLRSLGLAAAFLLALALSRRASASVRHVLALAGLASLLAAALFTAVLPSVRLTVLPAPVVLPTRIVTIPTAMPVVVEPLPVASASSEPARRPFPLPLVWAFGSLALSLRWAFGWLWLFFRLRRAERVDELDAPFPVLESDAFRVPVTAWAGHATIVLPLGWRDWPVERRDFVLRHEAAHARRGDGLALFLGRLACAVLWPNPLVWILARLESRLAERAVDDLVLHEGIPAPRYAKALLDLAREPRANGSLPALGMAGKAQVAHRVEMILNPKASRTLVPRDARRAVLSLALLAAVPVAVLGFDASPEQDRTASGAGSVSDRDAVVRPVTLECRVVRTDANVAAADLALKAEPGFVRSRRTSLLTAPVLHGVSGEEQTLHVTVKDATLRLVLRPELGPNSEWTLFNARFLIVRGRESVSSIGGVPMGRLGWAQIRLPNVPGERHAYVALVHLVPQPLVPPANRPLQRPAVSVAPTAVANPIAFRLRARVVRAPGLGAPPTKGSPTEPAIGQSDPGRVVDASDLYTGDGVPAALRIAIDGKVHIVQIRPDTGDDFRCVVNVGELARIGGASLGYGEVWYQTRAEEWIRYPLSELGGRATGYQLLLQVTPYRNDGPAPQVKSNIAPPAPSTPKPSTHQTKRVTGDPSRQVIVRKADGRVEILLKSEIVRTLDGGDGPLSVSSREPVFALPAKKLYAGMPDLGAISGKETGYDAYLNEGMVGARFLPTHLPSGDYRLRVTTMTSERKAPTIDWKGVYKDAREAVLGTVDVRPNGWVRLWLPDKVGRYQHLQMLVQVVPVKGE